MKRFLALLALVVALFFPHRALAETIFALTTANGLLTFDSGSPGKSTLIGPITGLLPGESVAGIDFRPATGQLYGLSLVPIGPTFAGRLSIIDTATAAATPIGPTFRPEILAGFAYGVSFDPVADLLRVVSDAGRNLRVSPVTGQVVGVDTQLAYAAGDVHAGVNPNVVGIAYTNSFPGATSTKLFGIDSGLGILAVQEPADDGILHTVGPLGSNTSEMAGLDISGATGTAYAALTPQIGIFLSGFYTVDLTTGTATFMGNIGTGGSPILGIAVAPSAAVPEPCTWLLCFAGSLGLLAHAKWRRRHELRPPACAAP